MSPPPHRAAFESFGVAVEVLTDSPELFERLPTVLPEWRTAPHATDVSTRFEVMRGGTIAIDGREVARTDGRPAIMLPTLERTLRQHLVLNAPDHVFVHAGVVAVEGVGIVLPGASLSGKSTLVAALVEQGASYYSDEYAAVDRAGSIHPFPRPISLRGEPSWRGRPAVVSVPEERLGREPIRAGLIALTSYEKDAEWRPAVRTRAEGAIALIEHTPATELRAAQAVEAAHRLAREARVLSGPRGEAAATARSLLAGMRLLVDAGRESPGEGRPERGRGPRTFEPAPVSEI